MKKERTLFFFMAFNMMVVTLSAQADYPWLRSGDVLYQNRDFTEAETMYRKALEENEKAQSEYNLGNSVYQQNRLDEATAAYKKAIDGAKDPELKASAYFNLGNAFFQQQQFQESIDAYKESLKLRPMDEAARKNLMLAMRQLQQQQQKQQQDQQNQDKEKKEEQPSSDQPQKNEQEKENQSPSKQEQQQDPSPVKEDVSKEEAREILKAIEREDQRVQEKLRKTKGSKAPPVKDW